MYERAHNILWLLLLFQISIENNKSNKDILLHSFFQQIYVYYYIKFSAIERKKKKKHFFFLLSLKNLAE